MIRTDGPARAGATYEELSRIAGPWKSVTRWRITEFDPPRRQVQQGKGVSTAKDMAAIIELSPAGQDTNFTLTARYTPRFGPVGALIDRAVRGSITRSQQRSAQAFAALVGRQNASP
jgi:Polyketide cyclase / dehydrase and lipid transport